MSETPLPAPKKPRSVGKVIVITGVLIVCGFYIAFGDWKHPPDEKPADTAPRTEMMLIGEKIELPRVVLACRELDVLRERCRACHAA
jgi:hypothetical protein